MRLKRIGKTVRDGNHVYAEVGVVVSNGASYPPVVELTVLSNGHFSLTLRSYGNSTGQELYHGQITEEN